MPQRQLAPTRRLIIHCYFVLLFWCFLYDAWGNKTVVSSGRSKAQLEAATLMHLCLDRPNASFWGQSEMVVDKESRSYENAVNRSLSLEAMDDFLACVEGRMAKSLELVNEEIAFQSIVRTDIAAFVENYTCGDDSLNSTGDIETRTWSYSDRRKRIVHVKHERPASRIHVIEDFIQPYECDAMQRAAVSKLRRAAVDDGKGGSQISEHRKAMQAEISVPWDEERNYNPIARIGRRVFDYTNYVLGLDISEDGQEDLMSIQYFGRGLNDTEPDRYTPHCDGDCKGFPYKKGSRMATMVMYCAVASRGGHTNFGNAGVHIKPTVGAAIFFSYIDPLTNWTDSGWTEHSGCPVFDGEKKIITQWIRWGVDSENPWDSFNNI